MPPIVDGAMASNVSPLAFCCSSLKRSLSFRTREPMWVPLDRHPRMDILAYSGLPSRTVLANLI